MSSRVSWFGRQPCGQHSRRWKRSDFLSYPFFPLLHTIPKARVGRTSPDPPGRGLRLLHPGRRLPRSRAEKQDTNSQIIRGRTSPLTPETEHSHPPATHTPPFSGTSHQNLIESYRTAKCEARKGGGKLSSFSLFFPFLSLFCRVYGGFWLFGFFYVLPVFASFLLLPPLRKDAPGKTPRPPAVRDPHPGGSRCPASPRPHRAKADPHQPEALLSPSENTGASRSAWGEEAGGGRGVSLPTPPDSKPAPLPTLAGLQVVPTGTAGHCQKLI